MRLKDHYLTTNLYNRTSRMYPSSLSQTRHSLISLCQGVEKRCLFGCSFVDSGDFHRQSLWVEIISTFVCDHSDRPCLYKRRSRLHLWVLDYIVCAVVAMLVIADLHCQSFV